MADSPISALYILPSYQGGFSFAWTISPQFTTAAPWVFTVERSESPEGPWTTISPSLVNNYMWHENPPMIVPKDQILIFRVKMLAGGKTYYSAMTSPYGILDKREFNLSREIMRKEILNLEQMAGVKVQLWHRVVFGPICTHCKDPITGDILDTACAYCFGTGRTPGYYGPYTIWAGFSVYDKDQQQTPDGTGVRQPYAHQVRLVNCPFIRDQDIIVDPCRDKRYFVDSVKTGIEMRRIPLINDVLVKEAPVSDPIYKVGLNG